VSRTARERFAALRQSFWRHPRVTSVSKAARGVYASGLSYCADSESDGFIPERVAVVMLAEGAKRDVAELVSAGMWSTTEGGYQVVSYLEHNQSKDELAAMRAAASEAGKRGGRPKGSAKPTLKGTLYPTLTPTLEGTPKPFERLDKADLDLEGDLEPPLRVGDAEVPRTLSERVLAHMALTPTPGSVIRLLDMLSMLHCKANGSPYAEPGMASENDKKALAKLIEQARRASAVEGIEPMAVIANQWLALLALVANGDTPPLRNPLAYFAKCFGNLEVTRSEAGAPFPVARTLEAVA